MRDPSLTVVLVADRHDESTVPRLLEQITRAGPHAVLVIARPAAAMGVAALAPGAQVVASDDVAADLAKIAAVLRAGTGPVLIAPTSLVASDTVLLSALADGPTAAWSVPAGSPAESTAAPVRVDRGRVVSAGSGWHRVSRPNGGFTGLLRVSVAAGGMGAAAIASAARQIGGTGVAGGAGPGAAVDAIDADAIEVALVALVRAGLTVGARATDGLVCRRTDDPTDARAALGEAAAVDEDRVRMRSCVKADDDLFATYAVSSWSPLLVRLAARLGLSPTMVTWMSVAVCLLAAASFAHATTTSAVFGAVLLYVGFVLDCVDGQLARYTQRFSRFGGWLDAMADRGKEFVVYAGLAIGASRSGHGDVWPLAIAAMVLLTVRHTTDVWYGFARDQGVARLAPSPFAVADDPFVGAEPANESGVFASLAAAANDPRRSVLHWLKKLIVLPIGERWMLIAGCAAIANGHVVFGALLGWGALAAAYTLVVRIARTWSAGAVSVGRHDVALYRDDGLLARLLAAAGRGGIPPLPTAALAAGGGGVLVIAQTGLFGPFGYAIVLAAVVFLLVQAALAGDNGHAGALDWLVPGALRAGELLAVVAAGYGLGVPQPLIFATVMVIALWHYDLSARLEKSASPLLWRRFGLGWDGRLLMVALVAMIANAWRTNAVVAWSVLTAYLVVGLLGGTLAGLVSPARAVRVPRARDPYLDAEINADSAAGGVSAGGDSAGGGRAAATADVVT